MGSNPTLSATDALMYKQVKHLIPLEWNHKRNNSTGVLEDFSTVVLRLESTNYCNFECIFCTYGEMERAKGFMPETFAYGVLKEASELGIKKLDLRFMGEPILDKRLPKIASKARQFGFNQIYIHTNGYGLTPKLLNKWKSGGITEAIISISPTREFSLTRPNKSANRFFKYVEELLKHPNDLDIVKFDYINSGISTPSEEEEFFNLFKKYNALDKVNNISLHNWGNGTTNKHFLCHRLWSSITVLWDGRISLCCLDSDGEYILGNLNENSLKDIVNSDQYINIRKNHAKGLFLNKCEKCDFPAQKEAIWESQVT